MVLVVTPDSTAPGRSRAFVSSQVGGWSRGDDAVLATSEVVSNAVEHGHPDRLEVRLYDSGGTVRVEVEGGDLRLNVAAPRSAPSPTRFSGRGWEIIAAVTDRAGSLTDSGVWFEIDR